MNGSVEHLPTQELKPAGKQTTLRSGTAAACTKSSNSTRPLTQENSRNPSGWHPAGRAVLVKTYQAEKISDIIEMPESYTDRMAMLEQRAEVIAVGESAWHDEPVPRARPGDHVIITKYAGYILAGEDGEIYRMINDRDIFARKA